MTEYGYIRVSTKEQKADRQMDALLECGLQRENIFFDKISGKDFARPEYKKLMTKIKRGDVVFVKSIDRLGRNYSEILNQWRVITKDIGANIEVLDMPILNTTAEKEGLTRVFISDLVLQILAYVAETERAFIKQRQMEGIAAAKSRGIKFGRKRIEPSEKFETAYAMWISGRLSSRDAAKLSGLSHTTFYRRCMERKD